MEYAKKWISIYVYDVGVSCIEW